MREAGRCAYALPTPGVVWQVAGCYRNAVSLLVSPLVPSPAPWTCKAADQGWKLGVGGGTDREQSSAVVSEQVSRLTDSAHSQDLAWNGGHLLWLAWNLFLGWQVAGACCLLGWQYPQRLRVVGYNHSESCGALPIVPTLQGRPEEENQLPAVSCLELASTVTQPLCHEHSGCPDTGPETSTPHPEGDASVPPCSR